MTGGGEARQTTLPMRIFTRYVLDELLYVFLFALAALTGLMVIGGVIREGISQNLPPGQLVRLIPYLLPQMLCITLPVTLLLSATSLYARMSGSNEIVAIKALGISPTAVVWPSMVLSFLLSLGAVWLNDVAMSWGRTGMQRVLVEAGEDIAYSMLRTQKQFTCAAFSIIVQDVDGRTLIRPTVTINPRKDSPAITIMADVAELQTDFNKNVLRIVARNYSVLIGIHNGVDLADPGVWEYEMPLGDASRSSRAADHPTMLALRAIPREIDEQRKDIEDYQQRLAVEAAQQMLLGEFSQLAGPEWKERHRRLESKWNRLYRLRIEPHRRWSAGFSCFCFVWVGAPMAIRLRNRDFLTSFFLCFLPILVVYYPLFMYGMDGAKEGRIPPACIWAGNALLLVWGFFLLRKVIRY